MDISANTQKVITSVTLTLGAEDTENLQQALTEAAIALNGSWNAVLRNFCENLNAQIGEAIQRALEGIAP